MIKLDKLTNNQITLAIVGFSVCLVIIGLFTSVVANRLNLDDKAGTATIPVSATIAPLADIVTNVGGSRVTVQKLLPSGASPHGYELTPNQAIDLAKSKVVFNIGHGIDDWVSTSLDADTQLVTVDKDINLIEAEEHAHDSEESGEEHEESVYDPHYWLSIPNGMLIARTVKDTLVEKYPEYADEFNQNYERYVEQLAKTDLELRRQLDVVTDRRLAVFHSAWAYFARDYGFEIVTVFQETAGIEPTAQELQEFQETITQGRIKAVFIEPQLSFESLEPIADDLNLPMIQLDPEGGLPEREKYTELMRFNVTQIVNALQ